MFRPKSTILIIPKKKRAARCTKHPASTQGPGNDTDNTKLIYMSTVEPAHCVTDEIKNNMNSKNHEPLQQTTVWFWKCLQYSRMHSIDSNAPLSSYQQLQKHFNRYTHKLTNLPTFIVDGNV